MKLLILLPALSLLFACGTAPRSQNDRDMLKSDANRTIERFQNDDASMSRFFESSVGYAVFPAVGKAGFGIGGAFGHGIVYENGAASGFCSISKGSIGFQFGGQTFRQIIFFETRAAMNSFKAGTMELSAEASAVILTAGAAETANYESGVAVFVATIGGAMYEASVGGQRFEYEPF